MPFAPVEGGQIHYEVDGEESLPALVLSNSLGTDLTMWDAQIPAFTQHFQILRYDSFGHGKSTFSSGEYKMEMLSKDVLKLFLWIPLRDLFGVAVWVVALFGNTVMWRGRKLRLDREGRIIKVI